MKSLRQIIALTLIGLAVLTPLPTTAGNMSQGPLGTGSHTMVQAYTSPEGAAPAGVNLPTASGGTPRRFPVELPAHLPASGPAYVPLTTFYYVDAVNGSDASGDGSPGNPWQTLTHALSQVDGPDVEIHAAPGTYDTALGEVFPLTMEPGVSLVGSGYTNTVVLGTSANYVFVFPNTVQYGSDTTIRGFRISGGSEGIRIYGTAGGGSSPTIEYNWIAGNGYGIRNVLSTSQHVSARIHHNLISGNTTYGIGDTARADYAHCEPLIEDNRITDNGSGGYYCTCSASGYNTAYCGATLQGNLIDRNHGSGIVCDTSYAGSCSPQITGNAIVYNEDWGVRRSQGVNYNVTSYPKLTNNLIYANTSGGVYLMTYGGHNDVATLVNNTIAVCATACLPSSTQLSGATATISTSRPATSATRTSARTGTPGSTRISRPIPCLPIPSTAIIMSCRPPRSSTPATAGSPTSRPRTSTAIRASWAPPWRWAPTRRSPTRSPWPSPLRLRGLYRCARSSPTQ
jgi:hypothetical protein